MQLRIRTTIQKKPYHYPKVTPGMQICPNAPVHQVPTVIATHTETTFKQPLRYLLLVLPPACDPASKPPQITQTTPRFMPLYRTCGRRHRRGSHSPGRTPRPQQVGVLRWYNRWQRPLLLLHLLFLTHTSHTLAPARLLLRLLKPIQQFAPLHTSARIGSIAGFEATRAIKGGGCAG